MKRFLRACLAIAASCVLLSSCGAPDNAGVPDDGDVVDEVDENIDYMAEAEEFMSKFEYKIECPVGLKYRKDGVGYGELVKTGYYSETLEKDRNVNIVLPDGYTKDKKYPVLYILHGIFGDQNSMTGEEDPNIIVPIENLIASGEAKEMILVFPYMYASKTQDVCTGIDVENSAAYDNFVNDLVNDLMPFMEKNYSVATGRKNTAIIGFSMGGRESLAIGLLKPELFGYVGGIAPAPGLVPGRDWAMEHPGQFAEEDIKFKDGVMPYLYMICSGDDDHTVGAFPKSYHELFEKNEITHVWYEIPGSDHGNPAIQSGIYNFCKYIFTVE